MPERNVTSAFDRALETVELSRAAAADAANRYPPHGGGLGQRVARIFRQQARPRDDPDIQGSPVRDVDPCVTSVLNAAIERAMLLDDGEMANAQLVDPDRQGLCLVAHSGFTPDFLDFFAIVRDTTSACGTALASGRPTWIADITSSTVFDGNALDVMLDAGSRAVASLPIRAPGGRLIAMLSIHHTHPTRWTNGRRFQLQRLAGSTGLVLDHVMRTGGP